MLFSALCAQSVAPFIIVENTKSDLEIKGVKLPKSIRICTLLRLASISQGGDTVFAPERWVCPCLDVFFFLKFFAQLQQQCGCSEEEI